MQKPCNPRIHEKYRFKSVIIPVAWEMCFLDPLELLKCHFSNIVFFIDTPFKIYRSNKPESTGKLSAVDIRFI